MRGKEIEHRTLSSVPGTLHVYSNISEDRGGYDDGDIMLTGMVIMVSHDEMVVVVMNGDRMVMVTMMMVVMRAISSLAQTPLLSLMKHCLSDVEPNCLDSVLTPLTTFWLCELGQVTLCFCGSVSSYVKWE